MIPAGQSGLHTPSHPFSPPQSSPFQQQSTHQHEQGDVRTFQQRLSISHSRAHVALTNHQIEMLREEMNTLDEQIRILESRTSSFRECFPNENLDVIPPERPTTKPICITDEYIQEFLDSGFLDTRRQMARRILLEYQRASSRFEQRHNGNTQGRSQDALALAARLNVHIERPNRRGNTPQPFAPDRSFRALHDASVNRNLRTRFPSIPHQRPRNFSDVQISLFQTVVFKADHPQAEATNLTQSRREVLHQQDSLLCDGRRGVWGEALEEILTQAELDEEHRVCGRAERAQIQRVVRAFCGMRGGSERMDGREFVSRLSSQS
ncbi:hypothetical protein BLNAU_21529 [Blattamonas nauphoetae]|uniref:Uncharacterized protein n=1 Tax=Blattamonas nauphoetae TaxID=2049346 RepID=A0ABQ9WXV9_9EUKA|nr:hypothetical protein BLNAU_21529 [Blattamonas nauphoetae]